jgi:hypothetical protein
MAARPACHVFWSVVLVVAATVDGRAQPAVEPAAPARVRLVFAEQALNDPLRARMYDVIATSVDKEAWPTIELTQPTDISAILDEYFDIYTKGSGRAPQTHRVLSGMIAEANPALVDPQSPNILAAGEVRLPPVPVRGFSLYAKDEVEARIFDPDDMSYALRAPDGNVVLRTETAMPTAADTEVRRGKLTEVVVSLTRLVRARLRTYATALRPILALDDTANAMATMRLLDEPAEHACDSAGQWFAHSPYMGSLQTIFTSAEIARLQSAAANVPLTVIDWNVDGDPKGHGSKVRAVVKETLTKFGLGTLDPFVKTFELNPARNRSELKRVLDAYEGFVTQQSGGQDLKTLFESADAWVRSFVPPDEYAVNQHVPSLVLQAVFWSQFSRVQVLNFSFTTDSAALAVLDNHFMPAARAFAVLAAGNSGLPASPVLQPQAEAFRWKNVVNVTHGHTDGTIDGDTTNPQYSVIVNLIAPGCGYTTAPITPDENGSSFASPYVAAFAWVRMLQGVAAGSIKGALVSASAPIPVIGQKVESGGLFDPALFLLHPSSHMVSADGAYLSLSKLAFTMTYRSDGSDITITNPTAGEPTYTVTFQTCGDAPRLCATVRRFAASAGIFLTSGPVRSISFDATSGQQRFQPADGLALLKLVRLITF